MKLSELFEEALNEFNVWDSLESILSETNQLTEGISSRLSLFLSEADKVIFDKFGIEHSSKDYFIAGSARLYLYPELVVAMRERDPSFPVNVGDLDIVIPNKALWFNAGLEDAYNKGGIYRPYALTPPLTTFNIEAFTVWDPSKAGGAYANVNVRDEAKIMADSTLLNGYRFMSLRDVFHYKYQMGRDKERAIGELINSHGKGNTPEETTTLINGVADIITSKYDNN